MTQNDGLMWVSHTNVRFAQTLQTPPLLSIISLFVHMCFFLLAVSFANIVAVCFFFWFISLYFLSAHLSISVSPSLINLLSVSASLTHIYFSELSGSSLGIPLAIYALNITLIPDLKSFTQTSIPRQEAPLHTSTHSNL